MAQWFFLQNVFIDYYYCIKHSQTGSLRWRLCIHVAYLILCDDNVLLLDNLISLVFARSRKIFHSEPSKENSVLTCEQKGYTT